MEKDAAELALVLGPALAVATVALFMVRRGFAHGLGRSLWSIAGAGILVLLVGLGATVWVRHIVTADLIPKCLSEEAAARGMGRVVLYECQQQGVIVALPLMSTAAALGLVVLGGIVLTLRGVSPKPSGTTPKRRSPRRP